MQQTFFGFVTSDLRFWAASVAAILRSLAVPFAVMTLAFGYAFGPAAAWSVAVALLFFAAIDWCCLIARMARRVALGLEEPNALLDRSMTANAAYLYRAYYCGPMPDLNVVRS